VSYNSYLINRYISIQTYGRWGFFLSVSEGENIFSWQVYPKMIYPLVSHNNDQTVDNWLARDETCKQVYGYPSLISLDGNSHVTGQQFYLYYMKVFPREDFTKRYLLRRKITFFKNPTYNFLAKVSLSKYEKQNPKKTKISTEISKPDEGYRKISTIGYLLPYRESNFYSLYECYIPGWQDYMPSVADPSVFNWEHCENVGDVFIRRIGWISKIQTLDANVPLYRCFDEQNLDHFLSTDPNCEGKTKEYLIGYVFQKSFDTLTFRCLLLNYSQNNFQADTNYDGKVNSFDFGKMIICSQ